MSVPLYWRQFTRDGSPDVDTQADAAFLAANFTDYFGQWLQVGDNGLARSYDALVMPYWSEKPTPELPSRQLRQTLTA
jgi:hypothetical protein